MPSTGDSFNSGDVLVGEFDYYGWYGSDTAAGNGSWVDVSGARSISVHVKTLSSGDSLVVQVSDAPSKPEDTTDGVTDQTINGSGAEQFVTLSKVPCRWMKLDKTGTNGAAEAYIHGKS